MKNQRTSYGTEDKRSSLQDLCSDVNRHSCEPICLVLVGLKAGWLADETWVEVKIFKIPYRLNYSDFYHV